ncbi:MAG: haloalkane dehalogenase [Candidatus Heimdallarchaeota archaeon]|nr:haloalkane dehalogenase [Candidatus Heimdallarchaeota archaeon]MDH5645487.1 haloalkane dehalogenase [Candidatus Heimdallarchaeota archaeon]
MKDILRTPDERFNNLIDYNFNPNYWEYQGIRMHYLDEGNGPIILLLHGEPSWSYIYRKFIPKLVEKGHRVIAPDLIGFGKSDKFTSAKDHTYQFHVDYVTQFVTELGLSDITLFIQDWGGLIGLRVCANLPDKFSRIMASNTGLPFQGGLKGLIAPYLIRKDIKKLGKVTEEQLTAKMNFPNWVAYCSTIEKLDIGNIIQGGSYRELSEEEIAAYNAPYPDETYKVGPRVLPSLVFTQLRKNAKIWNQVFKNWKKPFIVCFGDHEKITIRYKKLLLDIPGTNHDVNEDIPNASHFCQEDNVDFILAKLDNLMQLKLD